MICCGFYSVSWKLKSVFLSGPGCLVTAEIFSSPTLTVRIIISFIIIIINNNIRVSNSPLARPCDAITDFLTVFVVRFCARRCGSSGRGAGGADRQSCPGSCFCLCVHGAAGSVRRPPEEWGTAVRVGARWGSDVFVVLIQAWMFPLEERTSLPNLTQKRPDPNI